MGLQNTNEIDMLIIHCAATPNGKHFTTEDIDRWHGERGFKRDNTSIASYAPYLKHIGYHLVNYIDGEIHVGRSLHEIGAHAKGHNKNSIAMCLIGTDKFSIEQWDSLAYQVEYLKQELPSLKNIIGHNEVNSHKTCPGFDVQAWFAGGMMAMSGHILDEDLPDPFEEGDDDEENE